MDRGLTPKQWLLITLVVVLNIVVFGALIGPPEVERAITPTPTWTSYPTFTALPRPTPAAILMPTLRPGLRATPLGWSAAIQPSR